MRAFSSDPVASLEPRGAALSSRRKQANHQFTASNYEKNYDQPFCCIIVWTPLPATLSARPDYELPPLSTDVRQEF